MSVSVFKQLLQETSSKLSDMTFLIERRLWQIAFFLPSSNHFETLEGFRDIPQDFPRSKFFFFWKKTNKLFQQKSTFRKQITLLWLDLA